MKARVKSGQAVLDVSTGELVADRDPPYVRPPWFRMSLKFHPEGESMTQQHHRDQTDINNIVERYARTGNLPPGRLESQYADVTELQGDLGERILASRETMEAAEKFITEKRKSKSKPDGDKVGPQGTESVAPSPTKSPGDTDGGSPPKK